MNKRIAVITGAAGGIGNAIAERLIRENYFVLGVDTDECACRKLMTRFRKDEMQIAKLDISKEKSVRPFFEKVKNEYGKVDLLVNNAGITRDNLIWKMSMEEFDQVLNVNLRGTWIMCREVAKIMKGQEGGRIINISSRAWLGNRGQSNYSASKAGVIALTRVLALELGKYNVYVNAIAPGLIDTPLTQKLEKHVMQKLIDAQPTKKMGTPTDIANVVSFLANDATQFITGQTIYVDGGKSIGAAS